MRGRSRRLTRSAEVRALYERFAAAQNARDLERVRPLLLDAPIFLWVSDGQSFWGPDAVLARMASFQGAEVWRVEPDLGRCGGRPGERSRRLSPPAIDSGDRAAAKPDRLRFLVSMLGVETEDGWRIAALFTTTEKVLAVGVNGTPAADGARLRHDRQREADAMAPPIIYGPALSTYVRTVRLVCEEKGAEYQLVEIDIMTGAHKIARASGPSSLRPRAGVRA